MHVTHTATTKLGDGSTAEHTAEFLDFWYEADGVCVIEAACCGLIGNDPACRCGGRDCGECNTRSRHSFYSVAAMEHDEIQERIRAHVQRVAEHHAAAHKARDFIATLRKPQAAPDVPPGGRGKAAE